jgi:biopolymer transport protein ExbD
MKLNNRYNRSARIEMIPLIDVIFLLLIAFISFTMSMTVYKGMPIQLPSSSTAETVKKDFADITIKEDGKIFLNKEGINISELIVRLSALRMESPETKVLISGDKKASCEMIISVMDAVRKSGIKGISIETKWED